MKTSKTNSLLRLVAFLLITVVLIGVVGVVSEGMEKKPEQNNPTNQPESNIPSPPATDIPSVVTRYENYLSGLSCSLEESQEIPLCYMLTPSTAIYGIKDAELTIEFPLENGKTRLLLYTTKTSTLGKIGSIAPARKYITPLLSSFGGILVHNGEDDTVNYSSSEIKNNIDLSKSNAYSYTEGYAQVYTNNNLIANALENLRFITKQSQAPTLPYSFPDSLDKTVRGTYQAQNIRIPFHEENQAHLMYDVSCGEYKYERNGEYLTDLHTGESVSYKNAFILFCDTTTYERTDTTELVLETNEGGIGYYFTNGTMTKFIWIRDAEGRLLFNDLSGQKLVINRGNTYISFFKTTQKNSVTIY